MSEVPLYMDASPRRRTFLGPQSKPDTDRPTVVLWGERLLISEVPLYGASAWPRNLAGTDWLSHWRWP